MILLRQLTGNMLSIFIILFSFSSVESKEIDVATPVKYTALLMAVEFATIYTFDLADNSVSSSSFEEAFRNPTPKKDDDKFFTNYVLHPLMGSETYLRAREGNFGVPGSIAFSMGASITWEYLIESWVVHPSTQDLLVTTGVGWLIGELRYQLKQSNKEKGRSNFWIDPIWTTLEYLDFSLTRNGRETVPVFGVKFAL
ncbi:DUF3943 domain-containing protein [Desulfopila inferna]|uniref:DUF3943 domain-containing protein n=1 Tax=Desulfopila inferna TaxID=468528 RepID=UPI001962B60A|nr:DUF3943 domain-containing protein [Desulfopila inferna]MBM9604664.1 DUF3943 domain-containing protein [Desulfopila inferna]